MQSHLIYFFKGSKIIKKISTGWLVTFEARKGSERKRYRKVCKTKKTAQETETVFRQDSILWRYGTQDIAADLYIKTAFLAWCDAREKRLAKDDLNGLASAVQHLIKSVDIKNVFRLALQNVHVSQEKRLRLERDEYERLCKILKEIQTRTRKAFVI